MTDKLLQEIEYYLILYRAGEYSTERTAKEILTGGDDELHKQ